MSWIRTVAELFVPFRRSDRYRVPLAEFTTRANRTETFAARRVREEETSTLPLASAASTAADGVLLPLALGAGGPACVLGVAPGARGGIPASITDGVASPNGTWTSRRRRSFTKSPMML